MNESGSVSSLPHRVFLGWGPGPGRYTPAQPTSGSAGPAPGGRSPSAASGGRGGSGSSRSDSSRPGRRGGCPGDGGAGRGLARQPWARTSDARGRRRQSRGAVGSQMEWEQLVRKVVVLQVPGGRVHMMTPMDLGDTAPRKAGTQGPPRAPRTRSWGTMETVGRTLRRGSRPEPQRTASPLLCPWPRGDLPRSIPEEAST